MEVDLTAFRRTRLEVRTEDLSFLLTAGPTELGETVQLARPAEVAVRVVGDMHAVRVDVSADLRLHCPCDRCLEPATLEVPVRFTEEWRLARAARPGSAARQRAAEPETGDGGDAEGDAEVVVRRGVSDQAVDLGDAFWQNVGLSLPVKVLCAEGCRGLCPNCGANRNRQTCTCADPAPEPRLADLGRWGSGPRP